MEYIYEYGLFLAQALTFVAAIILVTAGLVAIALIGVGLGIDALMVGLPLAVVVILAGLVLDWITPRRIM